jgi:preprotein translocase subunit Sss1
MPILDKITLIGIAFFFIVGYVVMLLCKKDQCIFKK